MANTFDRYNPPSPGRTTKLDENGYSNLTKFDPETFMNENVNKWAQGHWSFGAGRRICPGLNFGVLNVWIAVACILYCFDIAEDLNHPINTFNTLGEDPTKAPFRIKISPRSKVHTELIEREGAVALAADY
ncbi:uncharacterized protein PAC_15025 [Phialocephala subalpina]|uniref:Cytochrome P450 n=1 Tax=Phialocephala subalpina TaxID=576137 RepID=A0A1L7XJ96_9HELO|nr:uncharacterized protein PAC_15025 [Phialocephala subalpina]